MTRGQKHFRERAGDTFALAAWDDEYGVDDDIDWEGRGPTFSPETLKWLRTRFAEKGLTYNWKDKRCGSYGCTFSVFRQGEFFALAKLTKDASEAAAAAVLAKVENPAVPKTLGVWALPGAAYLILREDLAPLETVLSPKGQKWIDWGVDAVVYDTISLNKKSALNVFMSLPKKDQKAIAAFLTNVKRLFEAGLFSTYDISDQNVRVRAETGELVIADLGRSTGPEATIPVAENPGYGRRRR